MTDDFSAVSGEEGAYVPCDEVALVVAASQQDTSAIYGEDEGFVAADTAAAADITDATDTSAVFGRATGFVPGPCEECEEFEDFDGTEASGWGSSVDDTWGLQTDGTTSVSGGYGRMEFSIPPFAVDNNREAIFDSGSLVLRTNAPWRMRARFSALTTPINGASGNTIAAVTVLNSVTNDQAVVSIERASDLSFGRCSLQVDENGTTIYDSGGFFASDPIAFDADGAFHEIQWDFAPGLTQEIYLDGGMILSGPAFVYSGTFFNNTFIQVHGSVGKAGAFAGSVTSTFLWDYIRFCE